jgi:hypothetical protein
MARCRQAFGERGSSRGKVAWPAVVAQMQTIPGRMGCTHRCPTLGIMALCENVILRVEPKQRRGSTNVSPGGS